MNLKHDSLLTLPSYRLRNRKDSIINIIDIYQPDFICTQELTLKHKALLFPYLEQYEAIGTFRYLKESYMFNEASEILVKKGKYKIIYSRTFWLSNKPNMIASRSMFSIFPRICTMVKIKDLKTMKKFYVYNTHLDHLIEKVRISQLEILKKEIMDQLEYENLPIIITGDFNTNDTSRSILNFIESLRKEDVHLESMYHYIHSFSTLHYHLGKAGKSKPIDHIFFSKQLEFVNGHIITHQLNDIFPSDHFPLFIKLKIK